MPIRNYNTVRRLTKLTTVPATSVAIIALWSVFFWDTEHFLLSTTIIATVNILCFIILYKYVFPAMIGKGSLLYIIPATLFFTALYTVIHLQLFNTGILVYPPPFIDLYYPEAFFIALFSVIGLTIYFSAIGLYLTLYTYLLSHESYFFLQKSYQSEINALRMQMNPHFISNALNSLVHLIRNQEKTNAIQYNKELIELLDGQLKYSNAETIGLKDELNWVEYYLNVEQQRMHYNFQYQFILEDNALYQYEIPPMILQPLVENSILHGFNPAFFTGKGKITIRITSKNLRSLRIIIEDDGIGNSIQPQVSYKKRPSISTENIQKRIRLINELGNFYISENKSISHSGTICEINISRNLLG